jgi:hypothetical protein
MVGRNRVPGRLVVARGTQRRLVGGLVLVPVGPLGDVLGKKLPLLRGVGGAVEQTLSLLPFGDVQKELDDARAG